MNLQVACEAESSSSFSEQPGVHQQTQGLSIVSFSADYCTLKRLQLMSW